MAQIYKSIKGGVVATLISKNEQEVVLKEENGQERVITESTLKRWWEPVEDSLQMEEPIEEVPIKEEAPVEVKASEKKKPNQKNFSSLHESIISFMHKMEEEVGISIFNSEKVKGFYSLKKDGRMYMVITLSPLQGITLWLRSAAIEGICEYKKMKHLFDARVSISEWNLSNYDLLVKLHDAALKHQMNKSKK